MIESTPFGEQLWNSTWINRSEMLIQYQCKIPINWSIKTIWNMVYRLSLELYDKFWNKKHILMAESEIKVPS